MTRRKALEKGHGVEGSPTPLLGGMANWEEASSGGKREASEEEQRHAANIRERKDVCVGKGRALT
jgi:hypothetical protein